MRLFPGLRANGNKTAAGAFAIKGAFWSLSAEQLFADLRSGPSGLPASVAVERLKTFGVNALSDEKRLVQALLLLRQFESPLVLILLFGASISMAMGNWAEAAFPRFLSGVSGFAHGG
jgi:Mg2+-importing ATPase